MIVKGIIDEDFVNYKKPSMVIECPYCSMKCGADKCQNADLVNMKNIEISNDDIIQRYLQNKITKAIVFQGLEPLESSNDVLDIIEKLRTYCMDDVVIYTGYYPHETVWFDRVIKGHQLSNVVMKYGRFIEDRPSVFDETLGVNLASDNQYAKRIS